MGRALSRAPSTSSIYAPPPPPVSAPVTQAPAPVSGRTPGRRGEKRARPDRDDKDDERRRKAGKIVRPQGAGQADRTKGREAPDGKDEDIFGARGSTIVSIDTDKAVPGQDAKARRTKIPQQVSDNKAVSDSVPVCDSLADGVDNQEADAGDAGRTGLSSLARPVQRSLRNDHQRLLLCFREPFPSSILQDRPRRLTPAGPPRRLPVG